MSPGLSTSTARGTDLARVRRLRGTPGEYDRSAWKKMAELSWLGILVPEAYGGSNEIQRNILAKHVLRLPG